MSSPGSVAVAATKKKAFRFMNFPLKTSENQLITDSYSIKTDLLTD